MGIEWGSGSQRRGSHTHAVARAVTGIRRLVARDGAVSDRSRAVTFSEHRRALDALRELHQVAAGSTCREAVPVPRWGFLTPAALTTGRGCGSQAAAVATRPRPAQLVPQSMADGSSPSVVTHP